VYLIIFQGDVVFINGIPFLYSIPEKEWMKSE
jgi:hypothetical protein